MACPGYEEVVLLTGLPSFGARKLCAELLRSPHTLVHAVVPCVSKTEDMDLLSELPEEQRSRVNLLEGDPAAMDLGLSGSELREIMPTVDRIHHMAQALGPSVDRKVATRINLGGAKEILEIAALCSSLRCLLFHSTADVSGVRQGIILEEDLDEHREFKTVADETMAHAETMMRASMPRLPIGVLRPTLVIGDSVTGEMDRESVAFQMLLLLLAIIGDFPNMLPSRSSSRFHVVPVDYYVRVACMIGRDPRAPGKTFHIGDPSPLMTRNIFELVASASGHRTSGGFFPANLAKTLLRAPGLDRLAGLPRALVEPFAAPVTYSFANTNELLAETAIRCPPFEAYIHRIVKYVQHTLRDKPARTADVDESARP